MIAAVLMVEAHQQADVIEAMSAARRAFYFRHVMELLEMKSEAMRSAAKST